MQDPKPIPFELCTHHVFLSVTGNTLKPGQELKDRLTPLGYKSWLYTEVIEERLMEKIFNGIKKSAFFIAFITPKYIESDYCMREIKLAHLLKKPIIPVVCEKFAVWPPDDIFIFVMDTIYIPLFNPNMEWDDASFHHCLTRLPDPKILNKRSDALTRATSTFDVSQIDTNETDDGKSDKMQNESQKHNFLLPPQALPLPVISSLSFKPFTIDHVKMRNKRNYSINNRRFRSRSICEFDYAESEALESHVKHHVEEVD